MESQIIREFSDCFDFHNSPEEFSSLALAFIGDSVFELLSRTYVLSQGVGRVNKMNAEARKLVNAHSQSEMYHKIEGVLTDEEKSVMKRGRNASSHTMAKNQSAADYRRATGVEALLGWLYLKGRTERLVELYLLCISE